MQPSGKVEVSIVAPYKPVTVYRQNDDGTWERIKSKVVNGMVIFEVDHFCKFILLNSDAEDTIVDIRTPSTTTINYGDKIILHAYTDGELPAGYQIKWISSNNNFSMTVSDDGTACTISPESSGDTVFTAVIVDEEDNVVSSDEQDMTAKAGLWQKIVAFFKKLFGLTKTYPEFYNSLF